MSRGWVCWGVKGQCMSRGCAHWGVRRQCMSRSWVCWGVRRQCMSRGWVCWGVKRWCMSRGCAHWGVRVSTDATPILNVHQPGTLVLQGQCSIQLYCQVFKVIAYGMCHGVTHTFTPVIKHSIKYTHLHIHTNHKTTWCQVHSLTHLHQSQNNMVPSILTHSHQS